MTKTKICTLFYAQNFKYTRLIQIVSYQILLFLLLYNGGLPNHFDNYCTEIASAKNKTCFFPKYYLSRMKTSLGSAFFKVYWSQNLVWYCWKFEISFTLL